MVNKSTEFMKLDIDLLFIGAVKKRATSPAKNNPAMGVLKLPIKIVDESMMAREYRYGTRLLELRLSIRGVNMFPRALDAAIDATRIPTMV